MHSTENKNFSQTVEVKFCAETEFEKKSLARLKKLVNSFGTQLENRLPEARVRTQNKMTETNCGDEKMERFPSG
jgi:hypothetical protein